MDPEIIDLSTLDFDNLDSSSSFSGKKSTNFGGGIELLMNDKKRESMSGSHGRSGGSGDIDIDDLTNLEDELNDLAAGGGGGGGSKQYSSDMFTGGNDYSQKPSVSFDEQPSISIGHATAETTKDNAKTWDGYGKFNNIPVDPDKHMNSSSQPQLTKEELLREKFKFLRKLEALEKKGVELTKKYSMESSLAEMQGEYEMILEEKSKQNSVKFQGNMMMAIINGIEFLNNRFDPFDIKLDGWGDQINENINDYDDIFGELYEKYKSKASMAPELKLLFQLGGSGMMIHMTNTMFKSSMPNMDDILKQNPDLMRQFQTAAVNSMGQSNPGFSGFMSGLMNNNDGPPPPMATQGPNSVPAPRDRGGNNSFTSRPDLSMGRSVFVDDGINIRENQQQQQRAPEVAEKSKRRAEMKGPSDISDILSGLKTKTINIQQSPPPQQNQMQQQQQQPLHSMNMESDAIFQALDGNSSNFLNSNGNAGNNESSTISISDLKELQSSGNIPKRSKRRKGSDKNTVSLDI